MKVDGILIIKSDRPAAKKVLFNAADFIGLQGGYIFEPIDKNSFADIENGYFLFSNIGMQRTLGSSFNFELKLGIGMEYSPTTNSGRLAGNFNIKFGYIFNKIK